MSWEERLREAAYTSPTGKRIAFTYEDVSESVTKRTQNFEFTLVDGGYVQDNGRGNRRFPLRCIFWGQDHDLEAAEFMAALLERGHGRLEHPLYGTFDVVPFGEITRNDALKSATNETILEVEFFSTIGLIYPESQTDPAQDVLTAVDEFDTAASTQYGESVDLTTTTAKSNTKSRIRDFLGKTNQALQGVSDQVAEARQEFADAQEVINLSIDSLIGQPILLAKQISELIKFPARAAAGIRDRLDGYARLADSIITSTAGRPQDAVTPFLPRRRTSVINDFHTADLFATNAVTGSIVSVVENQFFAKPDALLAAEFILNQFDDIVAWREAAFAELGEVDTGAAYQKLQSATALAAGYLVEISFTLIPERSVILGRPRTIIDLSAELYGSVDDKLDFLITSNKLTGSEILEIPKGRKIVYYA